ACGFGRESWHFSEITPYACGFGRESWHFSEITPYACGFGRDLRGRVLQTSQIRFRFQRKPVF
ncbi:MAG: hypothetical protein LUE26_06200, partial [Alistipes sp.]|nr:hypothetical protein [Alistipes sp.]